MRWVVNRSLKMLRIPFRYRHYAGLSNCMR